jgi:hypothetical protein
MIDSGAMPAKKKASHSEQEASYAVGGRLKVNLHTGRIVDATVRAVIEGTDGKHLLVDFGKDDTALVHLWQVVEEAVDFTAWLWLMDKKKERTLT